MYVLLAIEYETQESGAYSLRRLAARRVDGIWREVERLAVTSDLDVLASWLRPDEDTLCVWDSSQKMALENAWKAHFGGFLPYTIVPADQKTYRIMEKQVQPGTGLYEAAFARGLIKKTLPHGINNELSVLNKLMSVLGISQKKLRRESTPSDGSVTLQERNRAVILKTGYKYLFAKDSAVFHTKECPCARNVKNLQGSVYYEVAADGRRPCMRCKPVPSIIVPQPQSGKEAKRKAKELAAFNREIIPVNLMTGERVYLERREVLGNCWCDLHPGKLTKKLIVEHDCIGKECHYFQKYEELPYWKAKEQEKAARQNRKAKAKRVQKLQKQEEVRLEKTLQISQSGTQIAGLTQDARSRTR